MSQQKAIYDNKSQHDRVAAQIIEGEQLHAVYDLKGGGTGFLGVTDKRLVFMDQAILDRKDQAMISVPYSRISYVAIETEHRRLGFDDSSLTVAVTGRTFTFEFRGLDKAQRVHALILRKILG
jgi:hypothetical protein